MLRERGQEVLTAVVRRSGDRGIERVLGPRGLRLVFGEMCRRYDEEAAAGFLGEVLYELETTDGSVRPWTLTISAEGASARPGTVEDPTVRLRATVADFARIVTGEVDAGEALLDGRLHVYGDVAVAARLGEMFGEEGLLG